MSEILHIDGRTSALRIRPARTWWRRAIGLLATPALEDPCGLWIEPCHSVHTIGMRYAIDLAFLDRDGRILKLVPRLGPWRAAACRGARSTLELRAGLAAELGLTRGMQLKLLASHQVLVPPRPA